MINAGCLRHGDHINKSSCLRIRHGGARHIELRQESMTPLTALAFVPENDVICSCEAIVSGVFWAENDANEANNGKQQILNYLREITT